MSEVHLERESFDLRQLSDSIERARAVRGMTWAAISREVGVSTSTIRRFATASDAEADGVLALIGWLGVPPEQFVAESTIVGTRLLPAGDGVIRVDMELIAKASREKVRGHPRTRTTIQRLVTTAQESNVPVASLTRWSAV